MGILKPISEQPKCKLKHFLLNFPPPCRFPSVSAFMALSDELAVVDKFVCVKGDVTRALGMAVETVLNNGPMLAQRLKQGQYATMAAAAVAGSRSGTYRHIWLKLESVSSKYHLDVKSFLQFLK